jgi:hypothetical protein
MQSRVGAQQRLEDHLGDDLVGADQGAMRIDRAGFGLHAEPSFLRLCGKAQQGE